MLQVDVGNDISNFVLSNQPNLLIGISITSLIFSIVKSVKSFNFFFASKVKQTLTKMHLIVYEKFLRGFDFRFQY